MTSNNPNSVSQQGLTNKPPGRNNTQQSIVNYMSNSSNKIKTTEKVKTPKTTQTNEDHTQPQLSITSYLQHQSTLNRSIELNPYNDKVNNYISHKDFPSTTPNVGKNLAQTSITEYTHRAPLHASPHSSLLVQHQHILKDPLEFLLEEKPNGPISYPVPQHRTPTIDVHFPPPSPPQSDPLYRRSRRSTSYAHANALTGALSSAASKSGIQCGRPIDSYFRSMHAAQPTCSHPCLLQPPPTAEDLAAGCNKSGLLRHELEPLAGDVHGVTMQQCLELQTPAAQPQQTLLLPSRTVQLPPKTLASLLPDPCSIKPRVLQCNIIHLTQTRKDMLSQLTILQPLNTLDRAGSSVHTTCAHTRPTFSLDRSHQSQEASSHPYDTTASLQPGSDRYFKNRTILSLAPNSHRFVETPSTPKCKPNNPPAPPPLKSTKAKPLLTKRLTPESLQEDMDSTLQSTIQLQQNNPSTAQIVPVPAQTTVYKQQIITNFLKIKSTPVTTATDGQQHPKWVQQRLAWGQQTLSTGPSTPQRYYALPTIENIPRPQLQEKSYAKDQLELRRPPLPRPKVGAEHVNYQQMQMPPSQPTHLSSDDTGSTSDHDQLPPLQLSLVPLPLEDTTLHKSPQILDLSMDSRGQHILAPSLQHKPDQNSTSTFNKQQLQSENVHCPLHNQMNNATIVDQGGMPITSSVPVPRIQADSSSTQNKSNLGQLKENTEPEPRKIRTKGGHKRILLQYTTSPSDQRPLSYFHGASLQCDLHDAWGHTLPVLDTKKTFRVFLQNPNGINPSCANYSLLKDLHTCQQYGAAVVCLPETNLNWETGDSIGTFNSMLHRTWQHTSTATSRAVEPFLSSYQPGGTLNGV
jgi:hypothetical protein